MLANTFASVNGQDSRVTTWDSSSIRPRQFDDPAGIVIDPKGYVFVVDSDNDRIQKFTSNGTFIGQSGTPGSGPGHFNNPLGITINYVSGNVYVTDTAHNPIQKFTNNGTFIGQWGTPGSGPGQLSSPIGIDEDETKRNVYVTDLGNNRVQRFTTNGIFVY